MYKNIKKKQINQSSIKESTFPVVEGFPWQLVIFRCLISFLWIWGFHIDAAKTHVYWDIKACRHVCGLLDPEYKALRSLKTFATIFQFTWLNMPEDFISSNSLVLENPNPRHDHFRTLSFISTPKKFKQFFPHQDRLGFQSETWNFVKLSVTNWVHL